MGVVKMKEERITPQHPEGLTENQKRLADLLLETKIYAEVGRRISLPEGGFKLGKIKRLTNPIDLNPQKGEFALKHHEERPDDPLSPFFINLRNLPSEVLGYVGKVLAEIESVEKPDICAGIPEAGIPLAKAYSRYSNIGVRNIFEKKQTEAGRRIIPRAKAEKRLKVRLIDDVVTQAGTKREAIKSAGDAGYEIVDIFVLVDREQGGKEQLEKAGYKLYAAFTISQLLDYYVGTGKISQEKFSEVKRYLTLTKKSQSLVV